MRKLFVAAMAIGLMVSYGLTAPAADVEDGFTSLFNGNDLTGWVKHGGSAEYEVENGSTVSTPLRQAARKVSGTTWKSSVSDRLSRLG